MTAATAPSPVPADGDWQRELATAFRSGAELLAHLGLADCPHIEHDFECRVPRSFARRMRHGDPQDPLLRQVLPVAAELRAASGYVADPVGDLHSTLVPGLLHKYHGRALMVVTGACAVHCRYCFRREYPYGDESLTRGRLSAALERIRADKSLREIILSGGDPLTLSNDRLAVLLDQLSTVPHVTRLRIHTRVPVVLPSRVDAGLRELLGRQSRPLVIVLHVNHANECDAEFAAAAGALAASGATLLNQAVLLRGVNDDAATLAELSETLFAAGILPYYLHLLDPVRGAAHFDVAADRARALLAALAARLPGYLVPRLAREIPGEPSKSWLPPL